MSALSQQIVGEFWEICNTAYESWLSRHSLFDNNAGLDQLGHTHCAGFLGHLSVVTQRDVLHQIAKLHDPAVQAGRINLSIAYVIEYGGWDASTAALLNDLKVRLESLAAALKPMRNKMTAHNDLATILAAAPLGNFPHGADIEYFKNLQELMDIVAGGPRPFNDLVRNDARVFVESLMRGAKS